jgi:tRNA(fMet)-specific endonuclease VapC
LTLRYLLDTNIISDFIRNPQGGAYQKIMAIGDGACATSIIVSCELHYGIEKRQAHQFAKRVQSVLAILPILALDAPADRMYGKIRCALEARGKIIGNNDMLIAAQTLALDLILVTDNVGEFSRIEGLKIENWLRL